MYQACKPLCSRMATCLIGVCVWARSRGTQLPWHGWTCGPWCMGRDVGMNASKILWVIVSPCFMEWPPFCQRGISRFRSPLIPGHFGHFGNHSGIPGGFILAVDNRRVSQHGAFWAVDSPSKVPQHPPSQPPNLEVRPYDLKPPTTKSPVVSWLNMNQVHPGGDCIFTMFFDGLKQYCCVCTEHWLNEPGGLATMVPHWPVGPLESLNYKNEVVSGAVRRAFGDCQARMKLELFAHRHC